MDDGSMRQRSYANLISEIQQGLTGLERQAAQRAHESHPAALIRLAVIRSVLKYLESAKNSSNPAVYFEVPPSEYDPRRMTRKTIDLLRKHGIVAGQGTPKDIYILNAFSKGWGLTDLVAAQLQNRHTRQNTKRLLESNAAARWERAAETYLSNQVGHGKVRRCLLFLFSTGLLPGHHKNDVRRFCELAQRRDEMDWSSAPQSIIDVRRRLEQIATRLRKRKNRSKIKNGGGNHD